MAYTPIDPTVLTGVLNNQGTQATSANQATAIALAQNGTSTANVVMNDMGTLATASAQTTTNTYLAAIVTNTGTAGAELDTQIMNNQGTQATSAKQDTQTVLAQNGTSILVAIMNAQGTETTAALTPIMNAMGTVYTGSASTKTTLYTSAGNPIDTTQDSNGDWHMAVTAIQSVYASTKNSWNTQLAPSAIFYGTNETTLGVNAIQVVLKADQNCTVYVDQSSDNINYDIADAYAYYAALGGESWTTQAVGSSYRIRVLNLSSTGSTTTFRLGTALCPMVEAVPRALSVNGNFQVDIAEMLGDYGDHVHSTVTGQLSVAHNTRLLGATFSGPTLDPNFWNGINTGSTTISQANSVLTIATNATSNSTGTLSSVRIARYVSGMSNYFRGVIRAPAATGNNVRRWGAFNASNGFFFEVDSGTFSVVTRFNGADTKVSSGSLNGLQGSTYAVDTGVHTYQIFWSNKSTWFVIDDVLVHKTSSNATSPLSGDMALNASAQCSNTNGNTNANTLEVRVMSINRQGNQVTQPILKNINTQATTILKYGPGNLHELLVNKGSTAGGLCTIYDGTGNAAVWQTWGTLDVGVGSSTTISGQGKMAWDYKGVPFYQGLTLVTTVQTPDISVIYE